MLYSIIKKMLVVTGLLAASTTLLLSVTNTAVAACPAATVADMKGVKAGKYPPVSYTHLTLPTKRIV